MKTSKILAVVISSLIIRAFLEILLSSALKANVFYMESVMQIFMYALILLCLWRVYALDYRLSPFGGKNIKDLAPIIFMITIACILFSYGSMALVANIGSHVNPKAIYKYFDFHTKKGLVYGVFSGRTLIFMLATVIVAPIVEEIVFRGMLLNNLVKNRGPALGIILTSATFTIFHFSSPDLIGTFIFSLVLSAFYLEKKSIRACIAAHALYNFIAFIYQYYFGDWWVRSVDALKDVRSWSGSYFALALSIAAILSFYRLGWIGINRMKN